MADHMSMLRGFYARLMDLSRRLIALEDCECPFTNLKNTGPTTEKFPIRHFLASTQFLETEELGNANWLRRVENPTDCLAEVRSDMLPLLRLMESVASYPGALRPLPNLDLPIHLLYLRATPVTRPSLSWLAARIVLAF